MQKTLREGETDYSLFNFLTSSIKEFDSNDKTSGFHVLFLFKLSKFLGIEPENNYSDIKQIFDLKAGKFILGLPSHKDFLNKEESIIFFKLFNKEFNEIQLNKNEIHIMLKSLLKYYKIHLDRPSEIKSLQVLKEVFS